MSQSPFIVLQSVSKAYRRGATIVKALHDVTLEVRKGELARLYGPSGSGKTTLLNLIAALDYPDQGEIVVGGQNVARLSRADAALYRNERVGIIFQAYNLLPQLTALENVLLPMIPKARLERQHAMRLLDSVGLGSRSGHRPTQLSGGEQQRVAIARALANDPDLVLADEPTGNLDDENAQNIMNLLCSSCRERGKTLILVTHDRSSVQLADTALELRAGALTTVESFGSRFVNSITTS